MSDDKNTDEAKQRHADANRIGDDITVMPAGSQRFTWLERIGKLRDGILVIGGLLYIIGYLVWSYNSWKNNLGLLPAIDSQYFTAGIFPCLVIYISYLSIKIINLSVKRVREWGYFKRVFSTRKGRIRVSLLNIFLTFGFVATLVMATMMKSESVLLLIIISIAVFCCFFLMLLVPSPRADFINTISIYLVVGEICLVALISFLNIYPLLPQALGGMRPRCVYLDIAKKEVSQESLDAVLPTLNKTQSSENGLDLPASSTDKTDLQKSTEEFLNSEVIRSGKVDILFFGNESVLIKTSNTVYEIKRDAVHAVTPCK